jgi:predicted negative regulator of RcsB-dependent stress response
VPPPADPPPAGHTPALVQLHQGLRALQEGRPQEGLALCARIAEPDVRPLALTCEGEALLALEKPQQALQRGQKALRLRGSLATRLLIGDALRALGRCREAVTHYHLAARVAPDNPAVRRGLAACGAPAAPVVRKEAPRA